jgi:hypothetical protein
VPPGTLDAVMAQTGTGKKKKIMTIKIRVLTSCELIIRLIIEMSALLALTTLLITLSVVCLNAAGSRDNLLQRVVKIYSSSSSSSTCDFFCVLLRFQRIRSVAFMNVFPSKLVCCILFTYFAFPSS